MASFFKLTLPDSSRGAPRIDGKDTAIVWAADATQAKALAASARDGDVNAVWASATAVALVQPSDYEGWTFNADLDGGNYTAEYVGQAEDTIDDVGTALAVALNTERDLEGYVFEITIADETPIVVSHTGTAGQDIDAVAAALVVLLNATVPIAGASYTASTQTLQCAAIGDALGDEELTLLVTDPDEEDVSALFTGTIVDAGVSGAVLSVVLRNDGFIFSSSYNTGTNVLTVGAAVDRVGDEPLVMTATPPEGLYPDGTFDSAGFFTTFVDEGSIGSAVTVTLADVLPSPVQFFKS